MSDYNPADVGYKAFHPDLEADLRRDVTGGNELAAVRARLDELEAENELLRQPVAKWNQDGELEPGWTPVDAGRLAELEDAAARLDVYEKTLRPAKNLIYEVRHALDRIGAGDAAVEVFDDYGIDVARCEAVLDALR